VSEGKIRATLSDFHFGDFFLFDGSHDRTTKVFAIAGLDVEAFGSKSLFGFSLGLTLIIK
jgi:hypothetical protein